MTDHPADTPRLTDKDLKAIANGENWRDVVCSRCGRPYTTEVALTRFACAHCRRDGSVPGNDVQITPTGPTALSRALAEFRAARSLLADLRARGFIDECDTFPPSCWYCGATFERIYREDSDGVDYRGDHRPMEDGQPCLWVRIEQT
jgi:hypothetical protein